MVQNLKLILDWDPRGFQVRQRTDNVAIFISRAGPGQVARIRRAS
jgi:hypothetical protein